MVKDEKKEVEAKKRQQNSKVDSKKAKIAAMIAGVTAFSIICGVLGGLIFWQISGAGNSNRNSNNSSEVERFRGRNSGNLNFRPSDSNPPPQGAPNFENTEE